MTTAGGGRAPRDREVAQKKGDPFAAAGGFFEGEAAGEEGGEGFFFLSAQDAGENEAGAGAEGGGDGRGGGAEDFAEDVGGHHIVAAGGAPLEEIAPAEGDVAATIAAEVGAGGRKGARIVIESFDTGGAEFFGGDGEDAGTGADIEGGPTGWKSPGLRAEEAQTGGGCGVFAGAECHGAGDAQQDAGFRLRGGPAAVRVHHDEIRGQTQWAAGGIGAFDQTLDVDFGDPPPEGAAEGLQGGGAGAVGFEADDLGAGTRVDDKIGAEKSEAFAPGVLVGGGSVAHPAPDVAGRTCGVWHGAKVDLFSSRLKSAAGRIRRMIKSYAQWITGSGGDWLKNAGLFVLRVWLGLSMLLLHGWGKLEGRAESFATFPDPLGVGNALSVNLVIFAEVLCAILLVAGLAARFALIPLIVTMAVAFFVIHGGVLSGEGSGEMAFIYLAGFVALFIAGPGRYSFDHYILRAFRGDD